MGGISIKNKKIHIAVDFSAGQVTSLILNGRERLAAPAPLFRLRVRQEHATTVLTAYDAADFTLTENGAIYRDFPIAGLSVQVRLTVQQEAAWQIAVDLQNEALMIEWVDFPLLTLPPLKSQQAEILLPYNEGALISDEDAREENSLKYQEPEYPSAGSYYLFPNMISAQMMAYLWPDTGLYIGAHDPQRGVKGIDFEPGPRGNTLRLRLFCGTDYGESFRTDYPIIWSETEGNWESAAERYRCWFEENLPPSVRKITENKQLPSWYTDAPLVITYPVRGVHDTDEMCPNALFPYTNALPLIDELAETVKSRLMVLLMHWEGTAPWAPPYVWPPYGGEENFRAFLDALHQKGHLMGVYCSGFGYTLQSNLTDYNMEQEYHAKGLSQAMCAGPKGEIVSRICTAQRVGYDICPASPAGRKLLNDAYRPLFESGVDYAQILDQNHGGGQYFCYSADHGHPPAPGPWMTQKMQQLLGEWNQLAPNMLFGCESAAAEPFIGNLLFSDNRYELNYRIGHPVPLYAYLYHEYLRNFMGNQVSCSLSDDTDTLRYRLGYSFAAGDCMTLVLTPDGQFMSYWGMKDFSHLPDKEKTLKLVANLLRFYREKAKPWLSAGRMISAAPLACGSVTFNRKNTTRTVTLPALLTSAWEDPDGHRAQIIVNPGDTDETCTVNGQTVTVPALDAVLL